MKHAPEIAALYRDQARRLYDQGTSTPRFGRRRRDWRSSPNPETLDVLADAQIALVLGFLQLGDLQQADEVLAAVPAGHRQAQRDQAQGELWTAKARRAVDDRAIRSRPRARRPDARPATGHRRTGHARSTASNRGELRRPRCPGLDGSGRDSRPRVVHSGTMAATSPPSVRSAPG